MPSCRRDGIGVYHRTSVPRSGVEVCPEMSPGANLRRADAPINEKQGRIGVGKRITCSSSARSSAGTRKTYWKSPTRSRRYSPTRLTVRASSPVSSRASLAAQPSRLSSFSRRPPGRSQNGTQRSPASFHGVAATPSSSSSLAYNGRF